MHRGGGLRPAAQVEGVQVVGVSRRGRRPLGLRLGGPQVVQLLHLRPPVRGLDDGGRVAGRVVHVAVLLAQVLPLPAQPPEELLPQQHLRDRVTGWYSNP